MTEKKVVGANSVKKGSYVILDDSACKVTDVQISKSGKHGHAKVRIEAVGVMDGKKRDVVMPGHDNIEVPIIQKKTAQVLSISGTAANLMDIETFETFELPIPEELQGKIAEGTNVLYWQVLNDKFIVQSKGDA